ncbi:MAG TPA: hypothetical protein VFS00_22120, partial [Polyangiaceae bacterium]|nr:hypothetical protein [Polyangiaceae bacterium]
YANVGMKPDEPAEAAPPARGLYGQRPSASGDASRRAEFAAAWAMTPRQRMVLALALGDEARAWARRCGLGGAGR